MTTITINRAIVEQALEVLKFCTPKPRSTDDDYAEQGWQEHNAAITALSTALAHQAEPVEPVDVGLLEYRGNSVAFIHQKMTAYRTGIDVAWDAFRAKGLHPDGKTSLANMIAKYAAPPQRTMVPLTEEEIWALYFLLPLDDFEQSDRVDFARAVEKASWEKNNG